MAVSASTKWTLAAMFGVALAAVLVLMPSEPPEIASPNAAEFRQEARDVYTSALRESCPPVTAYPRSTYLAKQRRALASFEQRYGTGTIGRQLQAAREDAELDLGCSDDSDKAFAQVHVLLARTNVIKGLARMEQLVRQIGGGQLPPRAPSREAAVFRKQVRAAVDASDPLCAVSSKADNDTVLADAQRELDAFRKALEGNQRAFDFDVAQSDQFRTNSLAEIQCPAPSDLPVEELSGQAAEQTRQRIAELRKLL